MQGVPPFHDGSQDRKWIKEGNQDVVLNSPLVALSGGEGGFAEMESPVESDGQSTMAPSMDDVENPVGALRILRKKAYKPRQQLSPDILHSNHSIKSRDFEIRGVWRC